METRAYVKQLYNCDFGLKNILPTTMQKQRQEIEMGRRRSGSPGTPQNTHPLFLAKLPLNLQTVQAPPFLGNPLYVLVFRKSTPKNRIFP